MEILDLRLTIIDETPPRRSDMSQAAALEIESSSAATLDSEKRSSDREKLKREYGIFSV